MVKRRKEEGGGCSVFNRKSFRSDHSLFLMCVSGVHSCFSAEDLRGDVEFLREGLRMNLSKHFFNCEHGERLLWAFFRSKNSVENFF